MSQEKQTGEIIKFKPEPGVLLPWDDKKQEYEKITGDEKILKKVWENIEEIGNRFIWLCLTDF